MIDQTPGLTEHTLAKTMSKEVDKPRHLKESQSSVSEPAQQLAVNVTDYNSTSNRAFLQHLITNEGFNLNYL